MGRKLPRKAPVSLVLQKYFLMQTYGDLIETCVVKNNLLTCIIKLKPSEESDFYRVKVQYKLSGYSPDAWLLSPELKKMNGDYPHHIYGWDQKGHPQLCVYYPGYKEWNQQMIIANSFIPWVSTWLNTYEYWLITGEWQYDERRILKRK